MSERSLIAPTSFSPAGEREPRAASFAGERRAEPSGRMRRRGASAAVALCFVGPLLAFLTIVYVAPFLGVAEWSVTLPTARRRTISAARGRSAGALRVCSNLPHLRDCDRLLGCSGLCARLCLGARLAAATPPDRTLHPDPVLDSVLTRAFGWLALLSNRGLVNGWLQAVGLTDAPLQLAYNESSVVLGMTHALIPFAVFPLASSMRSIDERVLLAARGLGASRLRVFWSVFLPMTASGLVGAALIVFVFTLGFFVTPAILGGGRSIMVAELVYLRMFQSPDWGLGAAVSVALVLIVAGLMAALFRLAKPALVGGGR